MFQTDTQGNAPPFAGSNAKCHAFDGMADLQRQAAGINAALQM
ncbi:MAG: hypothetical protein N3G20_02040 [Verrucomicrobiae bacterium]|nr:hypothetical protein [Verrucomicrobiae bacterium]